MKDRLISRGTMTIRVGEVLSIEEESLIFKEYEKVKGTGSKKEAALVETLLKHNLLLVSKIAGELAGPNTYEDAFNEGAIALHRAIQTFKPGAGSSRISTWAGKQIRGRIMSFLLNTKTQIRVPLKEQSKRKAFLRLKDQFTLEHGDENADVALSEKTGLSAESIERLSQNGLSYVSLDAKSSGENNDASIAESIPDPKEDKVEAFVQKEDDLKILGEILQSYTPEERAILCAKVGLCDQNGQGMTLNEIGKNLHISREMVRLKFARMVKEIRECLTRRENAVMNAMGVSGDFNTKREMRKNHAMVKLWKLKRGVDTSAWVAKHDVMGQALKKTLSERPER